MKQYRLYNNITGWVVFLIAAVTYLLTIEPTASLWDCGEFIGTAYRLEVGHPPGAPFFMICARVFGVLAGDNTKFALMVNAFSALMSAFTILFLFWTITHIARKIVNSVEEKFSVENLILIIGSGVIGALAYTFSDTFWFSAVEGEVYASSSFFTAVVFWAILKWEDEADKPFANRWIILIAYLMGLSIGVHLLNLLAIPAIVFVYYFKKYQPTRNGIIIALGISVVMLGVVMYGIIQGLIKFASWFELLFVNSFGLPFNSGVLFYALLLIAGLIWGLHYTYKNKKALLNTILLAFTVIVIGYSSFAMIVIRSLAEPPINQNAPSNVFALLSYLNREQYGDRPLITGQYYNAPPVGEVEGKTIYAPINGRYEVVGNNTKYEYDERFTTVFPRMYSPDPSHIEVYKEYGKIKGRPVRVPDPRTGKEIIENVPTFSENMRFFFTYQLGYMYFRYFMWNFVGRQNDTQGHGEINHGNWISGFDVIDSKMIGDQKTLPDHLKKVPSRNVYYFLPLLLGLLGLFFLMNKNIKDFWVVMLLFILTGIAIVIYLNQNPIQPRERDYAYAGSFYAFAIWIGLGVMAIANLLKFLKNQPTLRAALSLAICATVPVILAAENWDDHNRSGRYAARAYARNYLETCAPNAIIFTYGDNDTFPLWYAQEVEGIRTDVRVVNTMLLNTDWYINQMKQKAYLSDPLPIELTREKYLSERRSVIYLIEKTMEPTNLKLAYQFAASDEDKFKIIQQDRRIDYIPTKNFYLDVDSAAVMASGTVRPEDAKLIEKRLQWKLSKGYLTKSEFIMMDILVHNNWKRPVYFAAPSSDGTLGLNDYLQVEGIAYRLVPIKTSREEMDYGRLRTDVMYDNIMNKYEWGRLNADDVYIDHFHDRTLSILRIRNMYGRLAIDLIKEGKMDKAVEVINKCMEVLPSKKSPHDWHSAKLFRACYMANMNDVANSMIKETFELGKKELNYFFSLKQTYLRSYNYEVQKNLRVMQDLMNLTREFGSTDLSKEIEKDFTEFYQKFSMMN